jgi:tetratricopeptide (TPR) repeat protein
MLDHRERAADPHGVRWSSSIAVWSIIVLCAPRADAQSNSQATRLFEEGRALAKEGKYEEACDRYSKSYELERAAGTLLNLGDCAEREGQLRRAWQMFDAVAREYKKTGRAKGAKFARERADALAPKLATVVVRLAEPGVAGLTIRIGGRAVPPEAEIVERLDAGAVPIEVGAPGREPFSTTADATVGAEVVVEVPALRAMDGVIVAPPPPPPPIEVRTRRQRTRVVIAAGVAGAGVIGLGVAGAFALSARSEYGKYQDKLDELCTPSCTQDVYDMAAPFYDRSVRRADLATGFVIGGAALAAGGLVLYLTAPREQITIAPAASPSGAGVTASIRF